MISFWEIVFCVPLLFRRHVCLSNLKQAPSRALPLTACKTVISHLKSTSRPALPLQFICAVCFNKRKSKLVSKSTRTPGSSVDHMHGDKEEENQENRSQRHHGYDRKDSDLNFIIESRN